LTIFGLLDWKDSPTKDTSRRNWTITVHTRFCGYIGGLIRVGKAFGNSDDVFGVVRITAVYREILRNMPLADVVREGGLEGETVEQFVTRYKQYFAKVKFKVPKVSGIGVKTVSKINWDFEYTVVRWEWVTRW
jgi:hypothetical protein